MENEHSTLLTMEQANECLKVLAKDGYANYLGKRKLQPLPNQSLVDETLTKLLLCGKAVLVDVDESISSSFDLSAAKKEGLVEVIPSSKRSEKQFSSMLKAMEYGKSAHDNIVNPLSMPISIEDERASYVPIRQAFLEGEEACDNLRFAKVAMGSHLKRFSNIANEINKIWPGQVNNSFNFYYKNVLGLARQTCGYSERSVAKEKYNLDNSKRLLSELQKDFSSDFTMTQFLSRFQPDTRALFNYSLDNYPYLEIDEFVGDTIDSGYSLEEFSSRYAYLQTIREIQNLADLTENGSYTFASSSSSEHRMHSETVPPALFVDDTIAIYKIALTINSVIPQPRTIDGLLRLREHSQYENFVRKMQEWASLSYLEDKDQISVMQNDIAEALKMLNKCTKIENTLKPTIKLFNLVSIPVGLADSLFGAITASVLLIVDVSSDFIINRCADKYKWIEFGK